MKPQANPTPADVAASSGITQTDDSLTALLTSHGLNVKDVTVNPAGGITVHWRKPATEAEIAMAQELAGQPVSHAI